MTTAARAPASALREDLVRAAGLIAVVTVFARAVGFIRQVVLGRSVGATFLGNTYATANAVPNIVFEVVAGGALASLVVPVLAGPVAARAREEIAATASALFTWTVVLLVPVTVAGFFAARPLMGLLVGPTDDPAVHAAEVTVGTRMLLVFLPQVVLYGVGVVAVGVLQAHRRFFAPAFAPLLSSLVVIAAFLLYAAAPGSGDLATLTRREELTLSVGTTLGVAALSLPLLVPVARLRLGLRPTLRFPPGVARRVVGLAGAGAAVLAAQQGALAVSLRLATPEQGGAIVFALATAVFLLPWAVLAVPLATSAFPTLSAAASADDEHRFAATAARSLRLVLAVSVVAAGVLIACAGPLARVLLAAAPGGGSGVAALHRAIVAFAPGLPGYAALALLTRALYARGAGRAAATATVAGWAVTAVADIVLVVVAPQGWRVAALGAGNSIGMTVAGLLLAGSLGRRAGRDVLAGAAGTLLRTVPAAAVAACLGWAAARGVAAALPDGPWAAVPALLAAGLVAAAVGGATALWPLRADLRDRPRALPPPAASPAFGPPGASPPHSPPHSRPSSDKDPGPDVAAREWTAGGGAAGGRIAGDG